MTATSGGVFRPSTTYVYDQNGNMTSSAGRTVTWNAFNKVASIAQGTTSVAYVYGPDHQRVKETTSVGGAATITHYFGVSPAGVNFEFVDGPTQDTWNDYLYAGGEMVGVQKRLDGGAVQSTRYFVKDHLGSIAVLTTETGVVAERLAFDAWGKRRNANGSDDVPGTLTAQTTRGFTGHEMIDEFDLVNMNGRIYDPLIGRFLSADPMIHDATNGQDLNRYSYVHNNPLSYTDMNGYGFFKSIGKFFKKFWKPLLAIVAAFLFQFVIAPGILTGNVGLDGFLTLATKTQAVVSGVSAGISSVISTGKPVAFLTGFAQGVATFGVGSAFEGVKGAAGVVGKAVAHGVVGGAFAEINGGKFMSGFLAAGFTSAAGKLDLGSTGANLIKSAVVGGAGSVLGGGKFANGAVTGAFVYLLNHALHEDLMKKGRVLLDRVIDIAGTQDFGELSDATKRQLQQIYLEHKWFRTIFKGPSASVVAALGATVSSGSAIDLATLETSPFTTSGFSAGVNFSVGWVFGFISGGLSDLAGPAIYAEADGVATGMAIMGLKERGGYSGFNGIWGLAIGAGPGVGLAAGETNTCLKTVLEAIATGC